MKASLKKVVTMLSGLQNHLPQEELDNLEDAEVQLIIDDLHNAGREFMRFIKNRACVQVVGGHFVNCDIDSYIPSGWSLKGEEAEHRRSGMVKLERRGDDLYANGRKIELFLAENQKDGIKGHYLRGVLTAKPVLNANILDYLLKPENQHLIPESWKCKYVFFWGDVYRDSYGYLCVRDLCWDGDGWRWDDRWLAYVFDCDSPAAVSASQ